MTSSNNKPLIFIHINFLYHPTKNFLGKTLINVHFSSFYSKKTLTYNQFSKKFFIGSIPNENSLVYTLEYNKFAPLANTIQDYHKQSGPIGTSKYHQKLFSQKMGMIYRIILPFFFPFNSSHLF
ncbi:hypothetical protein RIR_jg27953.t1 [Rhizophagus irregularis DAOM 181602=DAOM 197198]|nr:hypothetical protein RIR_jg27953.t1 [Rhizophagus irregularis DAOM 181602=DAOM 197198]